MNADPGPPETVSAPAACLRPRPLPECRSFWVTEFSVAAARSPYAFGGSSFLTWELGRMYNLATDRAAGGSVLVAIPASGGGEPRFGVRARYRRWFANQAAGDLGVALFYTTRWVDGAEQARVGAAVQGSVAASDLIGALVQLELTSDGVGAQVGARLGSILGAAVGAALPLLAGAVYLLSPE